MNILEHLEPAVRTGGETRMQQLRRATRSSHDRIEKVLPLLDPSLTRARYVRLLQAFCGFYAALEPLCVAATGPRLGAALDLAARAKVPLLVLDLCVLGLSSSEVRALPRCASLPRVASSSQAIGALYVLEGATLGAQIIRRHLKGTLGIDAANGASFFVGYGDRTRHMWTLFADEVDRDDELDVDEAVGAAIGTFEALERWLMASVDPT